MSGTSNVDNVLGKINEIRGFFKIGDEVIPFLGDLFMFLQEIMPLMTEMNSSIMDSTSKLPTASDKIVSATEAAEMATHEIMDKLDHISNRLPDLSKCTNDEGQKIIDEIQTDVFNTIYALQFQDITSQQLEHANRILTVIYEKFTELFQAFNQLKTQTKVGDRVIEAYGKTKSDEERQQEIEEFENKTEDKMRHESISQDDIDSLFG